MASASKGVPVKLDKERHLRFSLGMLRNMDENADVVEVLFQGLKHEDPELTPEAVGEIIDLSMMPDLVEPIRKATGGILNLKVMFPGLNGDGEATEGNEMKPESDG